MKISILERLLHAERYRPKLDENGSYSAPVAVSITNTPEQGPWVTSNSQGKFVVTRLDEGRVVQAFTNCPIEAEGRLLQELYGTLLTLRGVFRWKNVRKTIAAARQQMEADGYEAKHLVLPLADLEEVVGTALTAEDADRIMFAQGCVADVGGLKILTVGDELPKGSAILSALPSIVGVYTRVYDHVGVTIFQADRGSMVLVNGGVD